MSTLTEKSAIDFRDIDGMEELRAVEDLQIEAWGDEERDIVPLNQLVAAKYVGGTLVGAFDGNKLVGFAYGFYGHLRGRIVHHSHMLAVLPSYRSRNTAFRLKLVQRDRVLADGFTDRITWTFDPLQSINAYFNFAKLGVISDTYKIDVYGTTGTSFLHQNSTDRLFVTWLIESSRVNERIASLPGSLSIRDADRLSYSLLRVSGSGEPVGPEEAIELSGLSAVSIEVPADINSVERLNFEMAKVWRRETRRSFTEALSAGFTITDFCRNGEESGCYLLERIKIE